MRFKKTQLNGAFIIEPEFLEDERGFFARVFCMTEFSKAGLTNRIAQVNNSFSRSKGTFRGLHYQLSPKSEDKLIRCIRGSIYDVIVDLNPGSATYKEHFGIELNERNRKMLFVPKNFAHGLITLEDDTEIFYLSTEFYTPNLERGIRWNDPAFGINWPIDPVSISEKDNNLPDFDPDHHLGLMK